MTQVSVGGSSVLRLEEVANEEKLRRQGLPTDRVIVWLKNGHKSTFPFKPENRILVADNLFVAFETDEGGVFMTATSDVGAIYLPEPV